MSKEKRDPTDAEEEFVLDANDVKMLLQYIDGDYSISDNENFNSLVIDMEEFVNELED